MTIVLHYTFASGKVTPCVVNLHTGTLGDVFKQVLTFCYYVELDEETVLTALKPKNAPADFCVYVKLVSGEPVDLTESELNAYLSVHDEFIPDDI